MNEVKVSGKIIRDVYMGSGKTGKYASGTLEVKNSRGYNFWLQFYAPGDAASAFNGAQINEEFSIEGSLNETKRTISGEEKRFIQVDVTKAKRTAVNMPDRSHANPEITDEDLPF